MSENRVERATPRPAESPETRRSHSHQWTAPLSTEDRAQLHREAVAVLGAMCAKGAWTMSVPVRETDSDMVLCAALHDAKLLEAELASTRSALREAQWQRTVAKSGLENWGRHHSWCMKANAKPDTEGWLPPCNCGYEQAIAAADPVNVANSVSDTNVRAALDSAAGEGTT